MEIYLYVFNVDLFISFLGVVLFIFRFTYNYLNLDLFKCF
jgi:hypothetical protein